MPTKTNAAPLSAERRRVRGKLARTTALAASDPGLTDAVESLRRQYTYLSAAEYIEQVLGVAPALTPAQRDRLAQLLRTGGVEGDDCATFLYVPADDPDVGVGR